MPELTVEQFSLVYNAFSFTFAAMLATFAFLVLSRGEVLPKYRMALTLSSLVVLIAGYHYFRIFESWDAAFTFADGVYVASGAQFNDAYRYIDWLLTVPLLVAELVAVLGLARRQAGWMTFRLGTAAALMIVLGYPGEIAADTGTRLLWGTLSTIPFIYILYVLFAQLGDTIQKQPDNVRVLLRNARLLLLATWGFYPIVFLLPVLTGGAVTANAGVLVAVQVGYAIADVLAKCGYGILIFFIARAKSEHEQVAEHVSQNASQAVPAIGR